MFVTTKTIRKMLIAVVVLAALVPASASAMIDRGTGNGVAQGALSAEVVSPTSQSGGFQWGDAGIGAACMLVLVSAGAGLVVTARRRSHRQGLAVS
jgi:hypothetical protein